MRQKQNPEESGEEEEKGETGEEGGGFGDEKKQEVRR